jgi:hypothetical protein
MRFDCGEGVNTHRAALYVFTSFLKYITVFTVYIYNLVHPQKRTRSRKLRHRPESRITDVSTMSTFFDTIKRSYEDVEVTNKGINTAQFLEASESLVTMFGLPYLFHRGIDV